MRQVLKTPPQLDHFLLCERAQRAGQPSTVDDTPFTQDQLHRRKARTLGRSAARDLRHVLEAHDDLLGAGGRGEVAPLGRLPRLRRGCRRDV